MASKYCDRVKSCKHSWWCADDFHPERGNHECFIQLTNADRIRAMSDEELAESITEKFLYSAPREMREDKDAVQEVYDTTLEWLKSPVEVDNVGSD